MYHHGGITYTGKWCVAQCGMPWCDKSRQQAVFPFIHRRPPHHRILFSLPTNPVVVLERELRQRISNAANPVNLRVLSLTA